MGIWLATREQVISALDADYTARDFDQVDRALDAATDTVCALLRRAHIHPVVATRYFPWPPDDSSYPWRLWLDEHPLIELTALTSGGVTIPVVDTFSEPVNSGPPYESIELDRSASVSYGGGTTPQRDIAATGLWGLRNDEVAAGALAEALDDSETGVDVSNGAVVGVGSILRCGTERMVVTDRTWLDSTQNLAGDMDASTADQVVAVATGSAFHRHEVLLIDAEQLLVREVAGNNLIVERSFNGTTLAAHTGTPDVYVSRALTVTRGALGTTAASHSDATTLVTWKAPPLCESLAIAEAIVRVEQERGAYAGTVGAGEASRDPAGGTIDALRTQCRNAHGRQARLGVI